MVDRLPCAWCLEPEVHKRVCPSCGMQGRGVFLQKEWKIPVVQTRYHRDGTWWHEPDEYPCAFSEPSGYVIFESKEAINQTNFLKIEESGRVNLKVASLSLIPGYVRVSKPIIEEVLIEEDLIPEKRGSQLFVRDKRWSQVGFFLSKFGPGRYPPEELGKTWKDAINSFYRTLGEGRTEESFYWSLRNVRDEFDYWDNNVERVGHKADLRPINQEVKDEWENESREKIWSVIKDVRNVIGETDPVDKMHFPLAAEELQDQLDEERFEEGEEEDEQENVEDQDQRGWVYVLWCPAYPTWVVTGKAKNYRNRINGYQTYSPNRDYELVGLAYVENRKEGEEKLQDEIDNEHAGKRGKASNKPSEWFEITKEQAYEILERLNPESTFKNHPEED